MLQRTSDQSFRSTLSRRLWDVEFSCALENRTGKYFIGRDLISDQRGVIDRPYYWRFGASRPLAPLIERLLGLGMRIELRAAAIAGHPVLPRRRPARPMLHLDPHSAVHTTLGRRDVVLCHDLGPITHPVLFRPWVTRLYQQAYRRIAAAGPRMVFVSDHSRRAFASLFGEIDDMRVIYPPLRAEIGDRRMTPVAGLDQHYLLTVGSIGARKNQAAMIRAFARSGLANRGIAYVLCGAREPGAEAIEQLARQTPGVRLLDYVSDAELNWLYANATGFALVSRLEGFGVPVAEAISRDLVPLITRNSVLEEVAGPGALAVASDDEEAIAEGLIDLIYMSDSERADRLKLMQASLGRFSRERFAAAWREVLVA